jgi:thiaminase
MTKFVAWLQETLDGAPVSPIDRSRFQGIFRDVLRYELLFWEMAYRGEAWPN